ncbi:MAG: tyrosine-protein phosphatase [Angelakisella sp.]|nr:tyrosine-protein phosphatase [Angelakisella sp.]
MSSLFDSTRNTRALISHSLKMIRSDVPDQLSKDEIQWLIENHVITIIDLREPQEVQSKPCLWAQQREFVYLNIPISGGSAIPSSSEDVAASYIRMVDSTMWNLVTFIEGAKTNVLFFCTAGKDRTGVLSAILLSRCGASREKIIQDYMLSADNLKEMLEQYAMQHPAISLDAITPNKKYIANLLDYIKE